MKRIICFFIGHDYPEVEDCYEEVSAVTRCRRCGRIKE
jgi:hypothetical protein